MGQKQPTVRRNGELDFWRFVFAILIVLYHGRFFDHSGGVLLFSGGYIGVEFFFIVSGCLMVSSVERRTNTQTNNIARDTAHFIWRKIRSFIVIVYAAWILAFVVDHLHGYVTFEIIITNLVSSVWELLFLTCAGFEGYRSNDVTWYLSAMLIAMLILYPIMRISKKKFPLVAAILFAILFVYTFTNYNALDLTISPWFIISTGVLRALMDIIAGVFAYHLAEFLKTKHFTKAIRWAFSLASWIIYVGIFIYTANHTGSKLDWLFMLLFAIAVAITISQAGEGAKLFQKKVFIWLGAYSLALFLCHFCWRDLYWALLPESWSYLQGFGLYFATSAVSALAVFYLAKKINSYIKSSAKK